MSISGQVWTLQQFRIPPKQLEALRTADREQVCILFVNCEQKINEAWISLHDVPKEQEIEEQEVEEHEFELSTLPPVARKKSDATLLNQAEDRSAEAAATISPVANLRHMSKPPPSTTASASVLAANLTEASAFQPPESTRNIWADATAKSGSPKCGYRWSRLRQTKQRAKRRAMTCCVATPNKATMITTAALRTRTHRSQSGPRPCKKR